MSAGRARGVGRGPKPTLRVALSSSASSIVAFATVLACSSNSAGPAAGGSAGAASGGSAGLASQAGADGAAAGAAGVLASGGSAGSALGGSGGLAGGSEAAGAAGGGGAGGGGAGGGGAGGGGTAPTCITPPATQACVPPSGTTLPVCKLSLTGCMDAAAPTKFVAKAIPYEVNSPLWSDNAAKSRAFVLPPGGKIHVKNCMPNAGAAVLAADCMSPGGVPNGAAETGKWVYPVGTVMIKNFMFDGKLVETRLLMRVDAATSALLQSSYGFQLGTDWVGYNYAWNEAQTEASVVPNARTHVSFNTQAHTVSWNYPNFLDCVGCHSPAVGPIGAETDQMNRVPTGATLNQIDAFEAMNLFDSTAPTKPYAAPMVEPYKNPALGMAGPPAGSTVDQQARSYLAANCGFCHRPDVNDQGIDLRYSLSLKDTNVCNMMQQNGIPPNPQMQYVDFAPGNHASSAIWLRMNIMVPADPGTVDYGRMPSVASAVVDTQATSLIAQWIDAVKTCPTK